MESVPFASGREADVYAYGDGRILRRYRTGADATREAGVMAYVQGLGFPVPRVFSASGTDIVMERVEGPTMAEALLAGRLGIPDGAAMLADLLRRLHDLPAESGAGTIVHNDLHPENVLLTERGPIVIDWHNADDGEADLDTALSSLILAEVAIGSIAHPMGAAAGQLLDLFLARAPGDPARLLDQAVAIRSGQDTLTPEEIAAVPVAADRVRAAALRVRGEH